MNSELIWIIPVTITMIYSAYAYGRTKGQEDQINPHKIVSRKIKRQLKQLSTDIKDIKNQLK